MLWLESSNLKFLKLTHVFGTLTPTVAGWLVCLFSWKDPGLSSLLLRSFTFSLWVSLSSSPAMKRAFWLTANPLKGTGPLSSSSPPPLLLPLSPPPEDLNLKYKNQYFVLGCWLYRLWFSVQFLYNYLFPIPQPMFCPYLSSSAFFQRKSRRKGQK